MREIVWAVYEFIGALYANNNATDDEMEETWVHLKWTWSELQARVNKHIEDGDS